MTPRPLKIALYSPANLNVLDGSAIWVQSVAETLHAGKSNLITLPLKAPETRDLITGMLRRLERVDMIDPRSLKKTAPDGMRTEEFLDVLEKLDDERNFDVIILRSYGLCLAAAQRERFRGRMWSCYILEPERDITSPEYLADMTAITEASRYVLVQSEEMRALFESAVPAGYGKTILLPPAIPDAASARAPLDVVERMIYTGKFHPFYPVNRMVDFYGQLKGRHPGLEFHVAGDKIYRPRHDPEYAERLEHALMHTDGLVWHGGISRDAVEGLLARGGIALSLWDYRHGSRMNDLVVSTKLLDYCSVGLPVILNRTACQESLLGPDYPLFVTDPEEAFPLLQDLLSDPALYREAAERCYTASRRYTYGAVYGRLAPSLEREAPRPSRHSTGGRERIVLAGHSMTFAGHLRTHLTATADVTEDLWSNTDEHDEVASKEALARADVVLCEWALGNAVWYSRAVRPDQRLIVRLHRFELTTDLPERIAIDAVDRVVFVAPHILDAARAKYGWPAEKLVVIENAIDVDQHDRPKLPDSIFNLGMLGYAPQLKRLDRALDILEALRERDDRFRLSVKGMHPREYPWMWAKEPERAFIEAQEARIAAAPLLRGAVTFEPHGPDVASWLRTIGFLLSTSNVEGNQVAVMEAAASRAVPVVLERDGAAALYPPAWIHAGPAEAAAAVAAVVEEGTWAARGHDAAALARSRWSLEAVLPLWDELLDRTKERG